MKAGHARPLLAKPTLVRLFPDPFEVLRRAPVADADLGHGAGYCIPRRVEAGFLGGDFQEAVVGEIRTPLFFLNLEPLRDLEFEVGERGDPGPSR